MPQPQAVLLPCPPVGHRAFEKSLKNIRIEDTDTPQQITKFVRPTLCLTDALGAAFLEGELQRTDLAAAMAMFHYPKFIERCFAQHRELFLVSQCRIYQFQTIPARSGVPFVFGLFITDDQHNLIDFCLDTQQREKRRGILLRLIRAVCTPSSVNRKLSH